MDSKDGEYDGTTEQQRIDESDDYARINAANRNRNNLSFGGWMRLTLVHYLVWAVLIGLVLAAYLYL